MNPLGNGSTSLSIGLTINPTLTFESLLTIGADVIKLQTLVIDFDRQLLSITQPVPDTGSSSGTVLVVLAILVALLIGASLVFYIRRKRAARLAGELGAYDAL